MRSRGGSAPASAPGSILASVEDVTDRLKKASELMGIQLLDHIVFGREGFHSFAEAGEL
jgi:DNA repair protein RadC